MKYKKMFRVLASAIILALLMAVIPATPTLAVERDIVLSSSSGQIGDEITVTGIDWQPSTDDPEVERRVTIYFAGDEVAKGKYIDTHVDTYSKISGDPQVGYADEDGEGEFTSTFIVPSQLLNGTDDEDVTFGTYYIYITKISSTYIYAVAEFTVAGGEITITPAHGIVGTEVEISGIDFGNREDIYIEYDGEDIRIESGDDETDRDGEFADSLIIIPESTAGAHTITVIGDESETQVTAAFTVEPQMSISSTSGSSGTELTVTGTGFGNKIDVFIYFDNVEVVEEETDRDGSFDVSFTVPALEGGTYDVEAEDKDDNLDKAEFTIVASMDMDPTNGEVGTEVTVSGTGFSGAVTIKYDDTEIATAVADANGAFTAVFAVPMSTGGSHIVVASDAAGEKSATFTFIPIMSMDMDPTNGEVGTEVTVSGTGFSGAVTIKYDDTGIATAVVDANGDFTAVFAVPVGTQGSHIVVASDAAGEKSATFTVIPITVITIPSMSMSPLSGNVGTELIATGTGFSGAVTIKYDDTGIATAVADANGAFTAVFAAPVSTGGEHTVTISDSANVIQATFIMESEAPSVPAPQLPGAGDEIEADEDGDAVISLDWEDVTDPSGVTYTLQIASDADFNTMMLQKEALTNSEYTIDEAEKLEPTEKEAPYYWRVKAIDDASNESVWSTARSFYVVGVRDGITLPDWAKYTLIVLGVVFVGLLGFWIGRKTAYTYY